MDFVLDKVVIKYVIWVNYRNFNMIWVLEETKIYWNGKVDIIDWKRKVLKRTYSDIISVKEFIYIFI